MIAVVTGAAGNIGRAIAVRLARTGAHVVVTDLSSAGDGLERTRMACVDASPGGDVEAVGVVHCDVTDADAVNAAFERIKTEFGVPTMVVNNAGYQGGFANLVDADLDDLRRVLDVNVVGVFTVLQVAARAMRDAGVAGSVVNVASMAGVSGAPNMGAYSASKAAVVGLTKSASKDLAPIRVNAVSPGFIGPGVMWDRQVDRQAAVPSRYYTDDRDGVAAQMIGSVPLGRYGSVDEVAGAVLFLLSDDAGFISGVNLEIAGGGA